MEVSTPTHQSAETPGETSPTLTPLDKDLDNFESLLLQLLQAYTLENHPGTSALLGQTTMISGKALETLSPEQVTALVTSNSVNYEVIQQILAQQKIRPSAREGSSGPGSPQQQLDQNRGLSLELLLGNNTTQKDLSKSPMMPIDSSSLSSIASTNQQLQQLIQITPQQLQVLQSQVNDLLQSQHISLPPDLSPEQQQQLIQTLLLRQLHLQQSGGVATVSLKEGSSNAKQSSSSGKGKKPAKEEKTPVTVTSVEEPPTSGRAIVGALRSAEPVKSANAAGGKGGKVEEVEGGGGTGIRTRSKKVLVCVSVWPLI